MALRGHWRTRNGFWQIAGRRFRGRDSVLDCGSPLPLFIRGAVSREREASFELRRRLRSARGLWRTPRDDALSQPLPTAAPRNSPMKRKISRVAPCREGKATETRRDRSRSHVIVGPLAHTSAFSTAPVLWHGGRWAHFGKCAELSNHSLAALRAGPRTQTSASQTPPILAHASLSTLRKVCRISKSYPAVMRANSRPKTSNRWTTLYLSKRHSTKPRDSSFLRWRNKARPEMPVAVVI